MSKYIILILLSVLINVRCILAETTAIHSPIPITKDENKDKYQKLESIIRETYQTRKNYYELRNEWNKEKIEIENEISLLEKETSMMESAVKTEKDKLKTLDQSIEELQKDLKDKGKGSEQYYPLLLDYLNKLEQFIEQDLPFKKTDRMNTIQDVKNSFNDTSTTLSNLFIRVWQAFQTEEVYGHTNDIFEDTAMIGSDVKLVDILRIGRIGLYFKTKDEKTVGVLVPENNGYRWDTTLANTDKQEIINAYYIVQKRKSPVITTLPLSIMMK